MGFITTTDEHIASGGTISGNLTIDADLNVTGSTAITTNEVIQGTSIIDITNTEALLVRKDSDGGDVFTVDTTNSQVELGVDVKLVVKTSGYSGQLSINSSGYTDLQELGDRFIDLKSQRQIRMYTSDDGASYTQALNLSSTGGNATFLGNVTVGSDGSGKDVTFYSATAGDSFVWDASEEKLTITGTDGAVALDVADGLVKVQESLSITNGSGSFYVWSDDPFGSNYEVLRIDKPSGSDGRISVYKGASGTYRGLVFETGAATRMTIDAAGDVSIGGSLDIDGTTNLDNVDVDGTFTQDGGNVVFNEDSGDYDFRVESNGNANMLFIDGGNDIVGIGTASPLATLHVKHTTDDTDENGNLGLTIGGDSAGEIRHYFGVNNSSNYGYYGVVEHATAYRPMVLQPNGSYVGIGNTSPSYTLDVKANLEGNVARFWNDGDDGNRDVLFLQGGSDSAGFNTRFITFFDGDGGTVGCLQGASGTSNGGLALNITPDTNDLVVDSNGNVGIGAAPNASYLLHTNGGDVRSESSSFVLNLYDSQTYSAGSSGARIRLQGKDSAGNEKNLVDLIGTSRGADQGEFQVKVRNSSGNYTEYLRIEDDGATTVGVNDAVENSLGIGTTASITANTTKLQIGNHNTAVSAIYLTDNDAQDDWYIASNQTLAMGYNNSGKLSITQAGNVGINTNAPETKFTIDQTADDNAIRIYGYDDVSARYGEIFIDSSGYLNIDASTDRGIEIKGHANDFWVNSGADHFVRMTNDSKMGVGTTTPSQVLTVVGNIDLKNSSGFAKIDNSGSLSMADDSSVLISDSRNGSQLIIVYDISSGDGAVFFTSFTTAVTKLSGSTTYDTSDTDGKICVVRNLSGTGNNHDVSVKNRLGSTRNIVITVLAADSY